MKSKKMVVSILLTLVVVFVGIVIGIKWSYSTPELSITDVTFMPKNPIVNVDTETFSAKIQNMGKAKAGSFDVCLFDDEKLVDSKVIDGLDKEKSVDISFNYKFPTIGHHTVELVVDCKGKIREKIKLNNKVTFGFDVKETPSPITTTIFKKQLGGWYSTNYGGSVPVIYNGRIYVGGKNQYFFCLNKDTGEEIWKYEVSKAGLFPGIFSTPVFYKGNVYFGSTGSNLIESGGHIFSLNAKDGSLVWEYKTNCDVYSLSLDNGEIYALAGDGSIYRINALTGKLVKKYKIPERVFFSSSIVVYKGRIYVLGETSLFCIDGETGNILWTFKGEYMPSTPIVYYGKVYLEGRYCLDAEKGSLIWENKEVEKGSPVLDKNLFVGTVDGNFLCIDAISGETIWKCPINATVASPVVSNEKIYVGTEVFKQPEVGYLYCFGRSGNLLSAYKTDGIIITQPAVYGSKIYVVAEDGYIYCFEEQ